MCEARKECTRPDIYWAMIHRAPDGSKQKASRSLMSCARHLPGVIRGLRKLNIEFGGNVHRPDTDGVVVKMKSTNPITGFTFWE